MVERIGDGIRRPRLAAVQTRPITGQTATNTERATALVEGAVADGANLVVLPEFGLGGYRLSPELWDTAEPRDGQIVRWLRETAGRLGIYLGVSYLEVAGEDFFNTFVLAGPDGREAGRVRKEAPAMSETFYFRGEASAHVIDTPLGRIGVGICNDNHLASLPRLLQRQGADLVLMPHAWGTPFRASKLVGPEDIARQERMSREIAPLVAGYLGVPAVFANHCGAVDPASPPGLIARLLPPVTDYHFPGLSTIADSDGTVLGRLDSDEGYVVGEVTLDPARKVTALPPAYGRHAYPGPPGRWLLRIDEFFGRLGYARDAERRRKARALSAAGQGVASEPLG